MLLKKDVPLSFGTDVVPAVLDLSCLVLAVTKEKYITMILPSGKYRPRYSPKQFFGVTVEITV